MSGRCKASQSNVSTPSSGWCTDLRLLRRSAGRASSHSATNRSLARTSVSSRRSPGSSGYLADTARKLATASIAHGQVYKCADGNGKTSYSDAPCDSGSKVLKLPNDANGKATDANMCAQLLDERRRLAAEADRNAKRGQAERTDSAKRRQALTRQYEARCIGINRSGPGPK